MEASETFVPLMPLYGYARVSTLDQDLAIQHEEHAKMWGTSRRPCLTGDAIVVEGRVPTLEERPEPAVQGPSKSRPVKRCPTFWHALQYRAMLQNDRTHKQLTCASDCNRRIPALWGRICCEAGAARLGPLRLPDRPRRHELEGR